MSHSFRTTPPTSRAACSAFLGAPCPASPTFSAEPPVISIVSPIYCEGAGVETFLAAIDAVLIPLQLTYEIILVDDGSTDESWHYMLQGLALRPYLRCLRLSRNFGKEAALVAGIEAACGQAVITLDSDLQHPPEIIPKMIAIWQRGEADVVEAQKERRQRESTLSRCFAGLFYALFAAISPFDLTNASDFKLMGRRAVNAWMALGERRVFFRGMSRWVGFRRAVVLFPPADRVLGLSKWSFLAKLKLALDSLSAYSAQPLSLIWLMWGCFVALSLVMGAEALWTKFQGIATSGFTTVILLVLITGTCILASICLLSLYVRQIFHEVKSRPRYLVSEYAPDQAIDHFSKHSCIPLQTAVPSAASIGTPRPASQIQRESAGCRRLRFARKRRRTRSAGACIYKSHTTEV